MATHSSESAYGNGSWPDDEIKKLQAELLTEQQNYKTAEVEIQEHEAQIKALGDLKDTLDTIVTTYRQKYQELKDKQDGYDKFCDEERECLETVLASASEVCPLVAAIKKETADLDAGIKADEDALGQAQTERDNTAAARADAQTKFEAWKKLIASIEARLKVLEQLKKDICKEHEARNHAFAYYLLTCPGNTAISATTHLRS